MIGRNDFRRDDPGVWRDSRGINPHRLYRDSERGLVAGVCAGIANFFGIDAVYVRVAAVIALVPFSVPVLAAYIAFALLLPVRPQALFRSSEEESFWRGVAMDPGRSASSLSDRFRALEARLVAIESHVTGQDYDLRRKFRDLGDRG